MSLKIYCTQSICKLTPCQYFPCCWIWLFFNKSCLSISFFEWNSKIYLPIGKTFDNQQHASPYECEEGEYLQLWLALPLPLPLLLPLPLSLSPKTHFVNISQACQFLVCLPISVMLMAHNKHNWKLSGTWNWVWRGAVYYYYTQVCTIGRYDFGFFWNFNTGKQILPCVIETWRYDYILGSGGRVETPRQTTLGCEKSYNG